jgi:single-strand DNA-binding protein
MSYLNKIWLLGNLAKPPNLAYTRSGKAVCTLIIAINHAGTKTSKAETLFLEIQLFGEEAESGVHTYKKGEAVFVEGYLHQRSWKDRRTQEWREKMTIRADRLFSVQG